MGFRLGFREVVEAFQGISKDCRVLPRILKCFQGQSKGFQGRSKKFQEPFSDVNGFHKHSNGLHGRSGGVSRIFNGVLGGCRL